MRDDGRRPDQLRPLAIETGFQATAAGSALVRWGGTVVLCAASVEDRVPPFRQDSGGGWLTAEYAMLPGSTAPRKERRAGGREREIQRLIGRSLRAALDLDALGPRTVTIDCDVLEADGGTRVASISGGYVALALAVRRLAADGAIGADPLRRQIAAVSAGIVDGEALLDLPYAEDARADVDLNLVMTATGDIVEVQGCAEGEPFPRAALERLLDLGWTGIKEVARVQRAALEAA